LAPGAFEHEVRWLPQMLRMLAVVFACATAPEMRDRAPRRMAVVVNFIVAVVGVG